MTVYALLGLGALLFAQAVVRLRRRGRPDLAGWDRVVLFAAALALAWVALLSPLDRIAEEKLLAGHMTQHVLIGDLAAKKTTRGQSARSGRPQIGRAHV